MMPAARSAGATIQSPPGRWRRGMDVSGFREETAGGAGSPLMGEAGFRRLVESSADALIVVRFDGTMAWVNPAAGRLFNRPVSAMKDRPFGLPLTGRDSARVDILPAGGEPLVAEMRVVDVQWSGAAARLVSLRDVTHQVRMERSLRLSSVVFEQAAEGIAFIDGSLSLVEVNHAFADLIGTSAGSLAGRPLESLLAEVSPDARLGEALRTLGAGQRWRRELRLAGRGGPDRFVLVSAVHVVEEEAFEAHYVLLCTDITRQKLDQISLRHEARHDSLTGLANRPAFHENLRSALSRAERRGTKLAVLFLDLDGFKAINDQYGHERGDRLLETVARRLRAMVRAGDAVARLGGDEFTILIEDVVDAADVAAVAAKLGEAIRQPIDLGDVTLRVQSSIGASLYPENGETLDELLDRADLALYRVKESDPGGFRFFTAHMDRAALLLREKADRLGRALRTGDLRLVFQPQVDIESGVVCSVEALLRYPGRSVGWRRPARLVEIAEQARMVPDLLDRVLREAALTARSWSGAPPVAVNLCPTQLRFDDLDEHVLQALQRCGLTTDRIVLHFPVAGVMRHEESACRLAKRLRRAGVKVYLDHFGHGSFSISVLESLAPDGVCIDRRLVADMMSTPERRLTLRAMLAMLESMALPVVVQGVEHPAQIEWLRGMARGLILQGEQVAAPLESDGLVRWLEEAGTD